MWDCDAAEKATTLRDELPSIAKVTPFAFTRRQENSIARSGIENVYHEEILKPFSFSKVDDNGTLLGREFRKGHKTKFANHVLQHGNSDYFTHFQDLHDLVREILGCSADL